MRGNGNISREEMQRRMNERRGLGFFGSLAAFLGMVVLSAVLLIAGIDAGDWEAAIEQQGGVAQVIADLTGDDDGKADKSADAADPKGDSSSDAADPKSDSAADPAEEDEAAEEETELPDLSGHYYYDQLDESDREKYEAVYRVLGMGEKAEFPGTSVEAMERFHKYVWADHPELFFNDGMMYGADSDKNVMRISPKRYYSDDQIKQYQAQIDGVVKEIEAGIPAGADDYTKAKHVFEYLIANVAYDHSIADSAVRSTMPPERQGQTVVNALLEHSSVCTGYAESFQLVMQDLGVPCVLVEGDLNDGRGSHAWNLAQLDGSWYYVDVTWGDPDSVDNYVPGESMEAIRYGYLAATTSDMAASRNFADWQILPECTATADNFYVKAGRLLQAADAGQLSAWGDASLADGSNVVEFQCANQQVFDETTALLNSGVDFGGGRSYSWQADDKIRMFVLTIG